MVDEKMHSYLSLGYLYKSEYNNFSWDFQYSGHQFLFLSHCHTTSTSMIAYTGRWSVYYFIIIQNWSFIKIWIKLFREYTSAKMKLQIMRIYSFYYFFTCNMQLWRYKQKQSKLKNFQEIFIGFMALKGIYIQVQYLQIKGFLFVSETLLRQKYDWFFTWYYHIISSRTPQNNKCEM